MTVRQIIKRLEADGWRLVRQRGSHRQYKHPIKPGRVTVAGNDGDEISLRQANGVIHEAAA